MASLRPIERNEWVRAEWFEHYRHRRPTYCAMTVDLDVSALVQNARAAGRKNYPAQIWALATVVNRSAEPTTLAGVSLRPGHDETNGQSSGWR
ncbi:CatA-like O-acetyltransferase [Nocardia carnea]|uniref:CatA-like O-acetyltransferase n=1 Tax=Nocardia carnea TaxID=37328 RepID=UPI002457FECF|nr:CatA-like O-acetyltransferase [Nocardia carnea]